MFNRDSTEQQVVLENAGAQAIASFHAEINCANGKGHFDKELLFRISQDHDVGLMRTQPSRQRRGQLFGRVRHQWRHVRGGTVLFDAQTIAASQ